MNILIFNTFYYPKFVGGAEISVQILAEELLKAGNQVYVVTFGNEKAVERINGVVVIRVKQRNVFSTFRKEKRFSPLNKIWHLIDSCNPLNFFLISALLDKIKPAVVHTNNIQGFSPFIWTVIKKKGLPLVHTLRDYYLICHICSMYRDDRLCQKQCLRCKITYGIKKRFGHYPDCYIGISRFILEKHREYYPMDKQRKGVIYNSINKPELVHRVERGNKITYGFIGKISNAKGAAYLARELGTLSAKLKQEIRVLFAGKGEENYIRQLEQHLRGLEYEFLGTVKPADFYRKIDVLIMPSLWYEPFGRVVVEALSYSIPVCLTWTAGLKELYNPACTWRFSPSEGRLCELITYLSKHPREIAEKSVACMAHAESFSREHYVQNYMRVYKQMGIVGQKPAREAAGQTDEISCLLEDPGRL